jgi:hypothetical protein
MKSPGLADIAAGIMFALITIAAPAQGGDTPSRPGVPWPATDALARRLPTAADRSVRPPRSDRFVGIFYFLWHDNHGGKRAAGDGPYDVSKILARDPGAVNHPASPLWGPIGMYHYWAEPLYGYYLSTDQWVIQRHAQLLADAGIDTLIFDTTNAVTYPHVYHKICDVFSDMRRRGGQTPSIAFMVNTSAGATAKTIYEDIYKPGSYRDLWFIWRGRPLMICDPADASPELRQFFQLRRPHWPFTQVNTQNAWHWEATYPQVFGYTDDLQKPEQVSVSVAQNLRVSDGQVTNMSAGDARGRSFHAGTRDTTAGAVDRGFNFQEQWKRAIALDPPFVMVTGWNEWIAGRWGKPDAPVEFVDQFDQEFSRDIEPMKGGHGDDYYYQLVTNVRRYKGASPLPAPAQAHTIAIDRGFDQWKRVQPEFTDCAGDTRPRDHDGAGGLHHVDRTGRNDLVALKAAHDPENLFFYARTQQPLNLRSGKTPLWLFLNCGATADNDWEGYEYLVEFTSIDAGTARFKKNAGGWSWNEIATARYRVSGNELHVAIPWALIGSPGRKPSAAIEFKWVDNAQQPGNIMDFYHSGDVAPEGRFRYHYEAGTIDPAQ